jgi:hypothetical protein
MHRERLSPAETKYILDTNPSVLAWNEIQQAQSTACKKSPLGLEDWIELVRADRRLAKRQWIIDAVYHSNVERAVLDFFNKRETGWPRQFETEPDILNEFFDGLREAAQELAAEE